MIANSGYCSRRQAGRLIAGGEVNVNGKQALTDGWLDKTHSDEISINGQELAPPPPKTYLIYNKPVGVDCNYSNTNQASLLGKINHPYRVFPIGRLDKDSHGLLLLTFFPLIVS